MKQVYLGQTDILVSQIGLGTVKFGRNQSVKYPKLFDLPSDDEIVTLLSYANSFNVNLLDTAPAYGISEERLGKLITNRRDWIISTKVGEEFVNGKSHYDFSKTHIKKSIDRSLKKLKTEYLDIVLVHSNGDDKKIIEEDNVFEVLAKLKKAGKIRAFGMSTKTIEGGMLTVDLADVVMVTYNPVERGEKKVIEYAQEKQKGVFIKKGLASGHLRKIPGDDPVKTAIEFIFQQSGITSLIIGTLNKSHLEQAVTYAGHK